MGIPLLSRRPRVAVAACLLVACAGGGGAGSSGGSLEAEPMGRSATPRSGRITYDLLSVEMDGQRVLVDLEFVNGTSHWHKAVVTQVTLHGSGGETRSLELPIGGLRRGQEKRVRARFDDVGFEPSDVTVDLLYTVQ